MHTPEENPPTYTARSPVDLVALCPHLLGFHPSDSVVLMTFDGAERFHARVDLPTDEAGREQVAAMLLDVVLRHGVSRVAVLVYTEDADAARDVGVVLLEALEAAFVRVLDVLRVAAGRFHDGLDPVDPGTPYDLSTHPYTASRVAAGSVAHESREALAATLVGTDEADRAHVGRAADRFADRLLRDLAAAEGDLLDRVDAWSGRVRSAVDMGLSRLAAHDDDPRNHERSLLLPASEAGPLLVLLTQKPLRDAAWATIERPTARRQVDLWRDLVRRAPDELVAAPAALLGFSAWLAGDGALAWCAVDRCLAADPTCTMALLLGDALAAGVPPSTWDRFGDADDEPGHDPGHDPGHEADDDADEGGDDEGAGDGGESGRAQGWVDGLRVIDGEAWDEDVEGPGAAAG